MRTIVALGLGAVAMYFFDPQQGRRRRALIGDRWTHARRVARERAAATARDLSNRAYGTAMEARRGVRSEAEPQQPLETPPSAHHLGR